MALALNDASRPESASTARSRDNFDSSLRQPPRPKGAKKASRKTASRRSLMPSNSAVSIGGKASTRPKAPKSAGGGKRKTKKKSRKTLKRLKQEQERQMYLNQLKTEREKAKRELESYRQKTDFMKHRHQMGSEDKDRELRELTDAYHRLEDKLIEVTAELEVTKTKLNDQSRRVREYTGEDFRDCNESRLSQLEESARHLLFHVAEERKLRLHCAQCDNPLVSNVQLGEDGDYGQNGAQNPALELQVREDEQLVVFYPCKHARFCAKCARTMERCQVCSRAIASKVLFINSEML